MAAFAARLRDDLLKEVRRLAQDGRFDYLLIESTGISEPLTRGGHLQFPALKMVKASRMSPASIRW